MPGGLFALKVIQTLFGFTFEITISRLQTWSDAVISHTLFLDQSPINSGDQKSQSLGWPHPVTNGSADQRRPPWAIYWDMCSFAYTAVEINCTSNKSTSKFDTTHHPINKSNPNSQQICLHCHHKHSNTRQHLFMVRTQEYTWNLITPMAER